MPLLFNVSVYSNFKCGCWSVAVFCADLYTFEGVVDWLLWLDPVFNHLIGLKVQVFVKLFKAILMLILRLKNGWSLQIQSGCCKDL